MAQQAGQHRDGVQHAPLAKQGPDRSLKSRHPTHKPSDITSQDFSGAGGLMA